MEKIKVKKSLQQYEDYTKVGTFIMKTSTFKIYERSDARFGLIYTFIQITTNPYPMVYVYNITKGNLSRGKGDLWARQEVRSTSFAFHKGNPKKTAIPNNLDIALIIATEHISKYKQRTSFKV